jgi:pilus assembly protein Flp/PilA
MRCAIITAQLFGQSGRGSDQRKAQCAPSGRPAAEESGVTAVEYGLLTALIAVAAVAILGNVGTNLTAVFSKTASKL